MSVIRAVSKSYGPAQIDVQIEQGADFILPIKVQVGDPAQDLDLTGAMIEAWFSPQWAPGASQIPLVITRTDEAAGEFDVSFPAASSLALSLPFPPRKTVDQKVFELGGWILHITKDSDGDGPNLPITFRYAEGRMFMDRAPWLT